MDIILISKRFTGYSVRVGIETVNNPIRLNRRFLVTFGHAPQQPADAEDNAAAEQEG